MSLSTPQDRRTRSLSSHRAGYSIVELLIVVLILGIISVNVAPQFVAAVGKQNVSTAARRIKLDMEQARLRARTGATTQSVIFATDLNAYFLPNVAPVDPTQSVYRVDLSESGSAVVEMVSVGFPDASDTELQFNAHGIPDSTGVVVLRSGIFQQDIFVAATGVIGLGPVVQVP